MRRKETEQMGNEKEEMNRAKRGGKDTKIQEGARNLKNNCHGLSISSKLTGAVN